MGGRIDFAGLADLVLPRACAGCGDPGATLCAGCTGRLTGAVFAGGARAVRPDPTPAGLGSTWVAGAYVAPLAGLLRAYKDEGRRDLRDPLGVLLERAIGAAVADALGRHTAVDVVVAMPSSAAAIRQRGDRPVRDVVRVAAAGAGLPVADPLRLRGRVQDAAGLDARERAANLAGRMRARGRLDGVRVLLADDILTTGATLREAGRALEAAGAVVVTRVAVAATPRRPGVAHHGPAIWASVTP